MISKAKSAARKVRNWVRVRQWEHSIQERPRAFAPRIGGLTDRQAGAHRRKRSFGSFIYETTNIGDNIQSIAQLGFIPKDRKLKTVKRDYVDEYDGEKIVCIMNGWFKHNIQKWPPSLKIDPIFVSFHIAKDELASKEHKGYYRKYEPIGCRDYSTVKKLRKIGVEAYFSGCLTLTLENPYEEERGDEVVICDTHLDGDKEYPPSAPKILERLVPTEILSDATKVRHEVGLENRYNHKWKMNRARRLLELYARAKLVITSRMHCALPCMALNTPVLFIHREWSTDIRFDGYRELLRGYGPDSNSINIDWEDPSPVDISTIKKDLKKDVKDRVERKTR